MKTPEMITQEQTQDNPLANIATTDGNTERLATLKNLYPDLFNLEGNLNITELQKLVDPNSINETEKFEFKWFGKSQAKRNAFTPTNATLVFDQARSVNPQNSQNIIIEGENLEVLKLLKEGYREKIKCIYIDPPYNTGKDFVYSDNFTQEKKAYWQDNGTVDAGVKVDSNSESDGRYHSHWLNMMFSRLLVARELLRDDGVIFISIDDNEVHHLRKLCDEVFGESNFIECITWNKRVPKNDKGIGSIHEYILIYVKSSDVSHEFTMKKEGLEEIDELIQKLKKNKVPLDEAELELKKLYKKRDFDRGITLYNSLNQDYRLWGKINMSWPNANTFGHTYEVLHPITKKPVKRPDRGWRWKDSTFNLAAGIVDGEYKDVVELNDGSFVCGKIWFSKDEKTQASSITYFDEVETFLLRSILSTKSDGGIELENIFDGKSYFSYPKPSSLVKTLIDSIKLDKDDIILDFFGGSGTTGHAVMELNKVDGGNRQFILVQIPEQTDEASEAYKAGYKKISDITIARNQKVVEKLEAEGYAAGFKVFKLAMSNFPRVMFELDTNLDEAGNLQRLQQYINEKERQLFNAFDEANLLTEVLIKRGFKLNYQVAKAEQFSQNNVLWVEDGVKKCYVCLDNTLKDETVAYFTKNNEQHFICLERALDTTKKWNLKHAMGHFFFAF